MRYTVWHDDVVLGTVELPARQFVAGAMATQPHYSSVAELVRESTRAFLHLGLFYESALFERINAPDTARWLPAAREASRLRLTLIDARHHVAETNFVNLLEPGTDAGVVVIASFSETYQKHHRPASPEQRHGGLRFVDSVDGEGAGEG